MVPSCLRADEGSVGCRVDGEDDFLGTGCAVGWLGDRMRLGPRSPAGIPALRLQPATVHGALPPSVDCVGGARREAARPYAPRRSS